MLKKIYYAKPKLNVHTIIEKEIKRDRLEVKKKRKKILCHTF